MCVPPVTVSADPALQVGERAAEHRDAVDARRRRAMPANLSPLRANWYARSCWPSARMLTQKAPALSSAAWVVAGLVQADQHHRRFQRQRADRARGGAERRAVDGRRDHRDAAGEPPDDVAEDLLVGQRALGGVHDARLRFGASRRPRPGRAASPPARWSARAARSARLSVSAPSARPAQRISPGVSLSFGTTACIVSSPCRSSCDRLRASRGPGSAGRRACPSARTPGPRARRPRAAARAAPPRRSARVQPATIVSIACMLRPRARWSTKRGSVASSGMPITSASRANTESWFAAMRTWPSLVG